MWWWNTQRIHNSHIQTHTHTHTMNIHQPAHVTIRYAKNTTISNKKNIVDRLELNPQIYRTIRTENKLMGIHCGIGILRILWCMWPFYSSVFVGWHRVKMKNVETKFKKKETRKAIKMNQLELWKSNQSKLTRIVNVYYEFQCALIVRCRFVDVLRWLGQNRRKLTILKREPQNIRNNLISVPVGNCTHTNSYRLATIAMERRTDRHNLYAIE